MSGPPGSRPGAGAGVDLAAWSRFLDCVDAEEVHAILARAVLDLCDIEARLAGHVHRYAGAPDPMIHERLRVCVDAVDEATERLDTARLHALEHPTAGGRWDR